jgi:hypothetical protein
MMKPSGWMKSSRTSSTGLNVNVSGELSSLFEKREVLQIILHERTV